MSYTGAMNEGTITLGASVELADLVTNVAAVPAPTGGDFSDDFSADDFDT